jgi:hypothetical protein
MTGHATAAMSDIRTIRQRWLANARTRYGAPHSLLHLSTHGLLLQRDIERAFVGGAWAAVVILAQAVIEATMRDLITGDYDARAASLFEGSPRLDRIRLLRNDLLHPQPPGAPSRVWGIDGGDIVANHDALETEAKHAVEYMLYVVFSQREA